jgi:hypothetical protein
MIFRKIKKILKMNQGNPENLMKITVQTAEIDNCFSFSINFVSLRHKSSINSYEYAEDGKKTEQTETAAEKPKRLSKAAEFMKKYPNGMGVIVDMRAVMK